MKSTIYFQHIQENNNNAGKFLYAAPSDDGQLKLLCSKFSVYVFNLAFTIVEFMWAIIECESNSLSFKRSFIMFNVGVCREYNK